MTAPKTLEPNAVYEDSDKNHYYFSEENYRRGLKRVLTLWESYISLEKPEDLKEFLTDSQKIDEADSYEEFIKKYKN